MVVSRSILWAPLLAALCALGLAARARAQSCEAAPPPRGPVSILILDSARKVDEFAASVKDARAVVREPGTVVFEDGRVVTASADAATEHLNALGWGDRPIQVVAALPLRSAAPPRRRG
jgi:hypothetical protein